MPLLDKFWQPGGPHRVEHPFIRLASDGFWSLKFPRDQAETESGSISASWLRTHDGRAGLDNTTVIMLTQNPSRIAWAASILIMDACPSPTAVEVTAHLGLDLNR